MNKKRLILASQSPRRCEILKNAGFEFDVIASDAEENIKSKKSAEEIVKELAFQKAENVFKRFPDCVVIGADTVVVLNDEILGKPKDEKDAFFMLKKLSGKTHFVYTGVAILDSEEKIIFAEKSEVTFFDITDEKIKQYIETGEPMDKAGSYGIQGFGGAFVKEVVGSYFNVVGLPIEKVSKKLLKKFTKT